MAKRECHPADLWPAPLRRVANAAVRNGQVVIRSIPGRLHCGMKSVMVRLPGFCVIRPISDRPHCGLVASVSPMSLMTGHPAESRLAPLRHRGGPGAHRADGGASSRTRLAPLRCVRVTAFSLLNERSSSRSPAGSIAARARVGCGWWCPGHPADLRLAPLRHRGEHVERRIARESSSDPRLAPLRGRARARQPGQVIQPIPAGSIAAAP
jgi:hypothetical protein